LLLNKATKAMKAIAVFQGKLKGSHVSFKQDDPFSAVKVSGHIENLAPGKHGFHVHQFGNLLSSDCTSCGGHFNPTNANHGSRTGASSHAGDFGNITATKEHFSTFYFSTNKVSLFEGELSIIGRSLVVHEDEDDLGKGGHSDSLTTGHAGKRLDCAVIGYDKE
jgi:Cu-Zn family superoxide dismutase